jgi:hypothetical protein
MKNFNVRAFVSTLSVILAMLCSDSFAQKNQIVITGKVADKTTQEPLPYATISIVGKSIGVVSNQLGEFAFKLSDQYDNDTLMISMMGYTTYKCKIENIPDRNNLLVQLDPKTIILSEVVITDKKLTAKEIVEKAIANIPLNYTQEPYLLNGFYRDYKKENEKYIALLEAAIAIYDRGYIAPRPKQRRQLQEKVYINEIRKSKIVNYKAAIYTNLNLLDGLLISNDVRYVNFALDINAKKYELEKYVYLDEQLVYVINTNYPWFSRVFIDATSYAILEIEMDARWEGTDKNEWKMNDSIMNRTTFIKKNIKFKRHEGKYHLEYMSYFWRIEGFIKSTNRILFTSDFYQELLVNSIITTNATRPAQGNLMNAENVLELQTKPYNEAFWQSYNIIRESPLNKQIVKDLEEAGALEEQFKKSSINKKEERTINRSKKQPSQRLKN